MLSKREATLSLSLYLYLLTQVQVQRHDDIQTPTASAANGLTFTQRAKPITDAYYDVQPMCKWTAINGIVVHAIKTGKYADDEIRSGLLRLAEEGRTVTIETLRLAIEGLAPIDRPSRQQADQAQLERAMQRAIEREGHS